MPLQNRVTPFGEIVALPGRGLYTGNRGILHDERRRLVRSSQVRRWITCLLEYRGIRRVVMTPHRWTELFFLDEATAFSAGHRPCAECRRADYQRFCNFWEIARREEAKADAIDLALQANRRRHGAKVTYREDLARLPDGAFVADEGRAWLVWGSQLFEWSDAGYRRRVPRPARRNVVVLTPRPLVDVLRAGYDVALHPSAS